MNASSGSESLGDLNFPITLIVESSTDVPSGSTRMVSNGGSRKTNESIDTNSKHFFVSFCLPLCFL